MVDIAALCRTHSHDPAKVIATVETNLAFVARMRSKVEHVFFSVWRNDEHSDADCGLLYGAMRAAFASDRFVTVSQSGGDLFVKALNSQLAAIYLLGFDAVLVISATSGHFITRGVASAAYLALERDGCEAVAIVPPEVPSAGHGAITNQCAYWSLPFLMANGGFDKIDERPPDFTYETHHQGVAELANLFKSAQHQPLAVIYPDVGVGDVRTVMQDPRQLEKLRDKERRIDVVLGMLGKTREDLAALIRTGYPLDLRTESVA